MGRKPGSKLTEKHKLNISQSHEGKTHSDETKQKIADAHKRRISLSEEDYKKLINRARLLDETLNECLSDLIKIAFESLDRFDYV